jgi:hypothetical protein
MRRLPPQTFSVFRERVSDELIFVLESLIWIRSRGGAHKIGDVIMTIGHLGFDEAKML